MNGLLQQPQAPQQAPQQPQQGPQQGNGDQVYQAMIENVKSFLYSQQGVQAVKAALSKGSPANAIAAMTSRMLQQYMDKLKQGRKDVPHKLMMMAMLEIIGMIAEMAMEGGFIEQGQEDAVTREAAEIVMQDLGQNNKDLPPAKRQQFAQMAQGIFGGQA